MLQINKFIVDKLSNKIEHSFLSNDYFEIKGN